MPHELAESMPDADPSATEQGRVLREENATLREASRVDHLLIEELQAQALIQARDVETLGEALVTARRIGVAMGYIMALEKVTDEAAFQRLRTASQHQNRKLRDVAEDVLRAGREQRPETGSTA